MPHLLLHRHTLSIVFCCLLYSVYLLKTPHVDNEALSRLDQGQLKEAYSALTTLVIEAAKADVDGDGVR